ncbi:hypothetical protein NFI96_023548, partial [Prochilodus magdalenae]
MSVCPRSLLLGLLIILFLQDSVVGQRYASPDHHCPTTKPVMLNDGAGGITFSMASPKPVTPVTYAQ